MQTLWQDLRYGARMLIKNPGFTLIAVITLALGIGANTAIFSVVNGVLLRQLPYPDSGRLMVVRETKLPQLPEFSVAPGNFLDWQRQSTVFAHLVAYGGGTYYMIGHGEPERLRGGRVSAGFCATLGIRPEQGRDFLPEEDQPGRDQVALISNSLWQRRFGADPQVLGQTLTLSERSYTVIGVMPPHFQFPDQNTEFWTPLALTPRERQDHSKHGLAVTARLKPGVTVEQAQAEMTALAGRLAEQYPASNAGWNVKVVPMLEYAVGGVRRALLVLAVAVACVLLIACANVANLLLARAATREKEMAMRTALGASRWRLFRQLLTESVLLALLAGSASLLVAVWSLDLLLALAPLPRAQEVALDGRALGFTLMLTLLTGLFFGLAPGRQAAQLDLTAALKGSRRGSTGGVRRWRAGNFLITAEVALVLVLLLAAGLMTQTFWRLQRLDLGFDPQRLLNMSIVLPQSKYPAAQSRAAFFSHLIRQLSALPGVQSVGASQWSPFSGNYMLTFSVTGRAPQAPDKQPSMNYYAVSPDFFKTMDIHLLRGRAFTEHDGPGAPRVAIINETLAKRFFPDQDPIGQRIVISNAPDAAREIVGIVGDVRQVGREGKTQPQTYEPYLQQPFPSMNLVVRTTGDPSRLIPAVRREVFSLDPNQPIWGLGPVAEDVSNSVRGERFSMLLLGTFAVVALALAAAGIYGVTAYSVAQRTQEIGIRLALGALPRDVLRLVVRQGMTPALLGVALGLAAAFALTRLMAGLLYGVSATDPLTFVVIALLLALVALAACWIPARRAMKVDPMIALRCE